MNIKCDRSKWIDSEDTVNTDKKCLHVDWMNLLLTRNSTEPVEISGSYLRSSVSLGTAWLEPWPQPQPHSMVLYVQSSTHEPKLNMHMFSHVKDPTCGIYTREGIKRSSSLCHFFAHTHTHILSLTYTHIYALPHTHTHTHTHTHRHTHKHTHTHAGEGHRHI